MLDTIFWLWHAANVYLGAIAAGGLFLAAAAAWFRLPLVGHYAGFGLALAGAVMLSEAHGYARGTAAAEQSAMRSRLAAEQAHAEELDRQARATREIAAAADAAKKRDAQEIANLTEGVQAYADYVASLPADAGCIATDDDERRMRAVFGPEPVRAGGKAPAEPAAHPR